MGYVELVAEHLHVHVKRMGWERKGTPACLISVFRAAHPRLTVSFGLQMMPGTKLAGPQTYVDSPVSTSHLAQDKHTVHHSSKKLLLAKDGDYSRIPQLVRHREYTSERCPVVGGTSS